MTDRDERLDYLECKVRIDEHGLFVVLFDDEEETFNTYALAKGAIETFAKRNSAKLELAVIDETCKKCTIEGINRTSSILRGPGLPTSSYGHVALYPDVLWIATKIGELVMAKTEVDRLEEQLEPYRLHPHLPGYGGRMPISALDGALNSVRIEHEEKLAAAKAAEPYVKAGIERPVPAADGSGG